MNLLVAEQLHASLRDPALETIGFLNEVMGRYPDAISFAPGAPHLDFVRGLDIGRCVDRWLGHVADQGLGLERARQLLFEYGPSRGLINDLVADALRRDHALEVPAEAVVITVGAQEAMLLTLRALFGSRRDRLAVSSPCFPGIVGAARLLDIEVVPIPETCRGIDVDHLMDVCATARGTGGRIRACYVAPDFANPSGTRMDLGSRQRLLELAEREDFHLLEDNVYGFTAAPGHELPGLKCLDRTDRVIHVGTFAKTCFPGARVGFVLADQRVRTADGTTRWLADEIAALKSMVTVNTPPISQAVIGGMLLEHGGSLVALGRQKTGLYRRNLALLCDALDRHLPTGLSDGVSWHRPEGGFFVLMRLPVAADSELLEVSAAKYRVLWTPMYPFYLDGGGTTVLRLSCSYLDPEEIEIGVARLSRFLREEVAS